MKRIPDPMNEIVKVLLGIGAAYGLYRFVGDLSPWMRTLLMRGGAE